MVIVATILAVVLFVAMNEGTLPDPLAAKPIAVLLFDQVNEVPLTGLDSVVAGAETPLQKA